MREVNALGFDVVCLWFLARKEERSDVSDESKSEGEASGSDSDEGVGDGDVDEGVVERVPA